MRAQSLTQRRVALLSGARPLIRRWRRSPRELVRQLKLLVDEFTPASRIAYQLHRNDPRDYVSDSDFEGCVRHLNGDAAALLDSKLWFHSLFRTAFAAQMPRCFGVVVAGHTMPLWEGDGRSLESVLDDGPGVVLRPVWGSQGEGVRIVRRTGDAPAELAAAVRSAGSAIITEFVEQHPYAAAISSTTTNTIRVLTLRDPVSGRPFLAAAVHRFGTLESAPVDNMARGGLMTAVDLATGELGLTASFQGDRLSWYDHHPDSGARIRGTTVPGWQDVVSLTLALADHVDDVVYAGWDVVVTSAGPVVLEANSAAGVRMLQVHGGLLTDAAVRAFFRAHGLPGISV